MTVFAGKFGYYWLLVLTPPFTGYLRLPDSAACFHGKETILLVEDDDELRHLFVDYLGAKSHRVIEDVSCLASDDIGLQTYCRRDARIFL